MHDSRGRTPLVGLLGSGRLRRAVRDAIAERPGITAVELAAADAADRRLALLIVASDGWRVDHTEVRSIAAAGATPWLPVRTELGRAVVGPMETPGEPGCVGCGETRRRQVRVDQGAHDAVYQRHRESLKDRPSAWLTGLAAHLVGALATEEAALLHGGRVPRTRRALLAVDLRWLSVATHQFLPDPLCPICGDAPDDAPDLARIALRSRPTHARATFRARDLGTQLSTLHDLYVDAETGLVRSVDGWGGGGLVVTKAPVGIREHGADSVAGYGHTSRFGDSTLTALLEALERYAAAPGGRRTVVRGSYRELADQALDPRTLGLYPAERYRLQGFPYRPFTVDRQYRWVWGWSFARQAPILVPECYAYYGVHPGEEDGPRFVYEISNGCAIGSCLEEAILHGILEVAERDAFLLTWYARLPAARIDLSPARDRTAVMLEATITAETGYRVALYDITTEHGIPCVWAMALNPTPDHRPALVCTAGAHPNPERAARNALSELGPLTSQLVRRYADHTDRAAAMVADSALVTEMDDHALLYADPRAAARLDFLTTSRMVRPVGEVGSRDRGGFDTEDLCDQVREAVGRYLDTGLDVVVVDQTAAEHRAGGLSCVKVIIPGTLPMTFGHHHRRVDGLPRLYGVPRLMGYRDRPLRADELNPYPHPFP